MRIQAVAAISNPVDLKRDIDIAADEASKILYASSRRLQAWRKLRRLAQPWRTMGGGLDWI